MTFDECRTCKYAFTTGKDRLYCKKSLADKDDCGEYSAMEREPPKDGKSDVLNKIIAEIKQIADEEQKHDKKWTMGLRYAVKIIDKYRESEDKE